MGIRQALSGKRAETDMTSGSILRHLLLFSLPLLMGNVFQQLYNMVDTWVVGNYVSNEAFSAVGTLTPITNMLIGTFIGLSTGSSVVIAQCFGARDTERVEKAVHTSVVMTFVLSLGLSVLGVLISPRLLLMMKVPTEVLPEAKSYLTIYFAGVSGLLFYNMGAGIMRAVGDSRRPFYYLVVCALLNTVLDLVFVIRFHWGVKGVAWATILAQFFSAFLTMAALFRTDSCVKVRFRKLKCHAALLKQIIMVGLPAALQMAITSFSNIFVQSYINQFGADCMSGWTAYMKLDNFLLLPMQSLSLTITTFVGQNIGKGDISRAKKGIGRALLLSVIITGVLGSILMVWAPVCIAFFNAKPEVVANGTMFLRWLTPFYLICCVNGIYCAALRGSGHSLLTMLIILFSFVVVRQAYLFLVSRYISNTMLAIAFGFPVGWTVCSLLSWIGYLAVDLGRKRVAG